MGFSPPVQAVSDRIVAVVEAAIISEKPVKQQIITESEVQETMRPLLAKMRASGERVDEEMVRKKVLEEMIQRILREQKAEQLGVIVEEKDLDAVMAQVERNNNLPPGTLPEALIRQGMDPQQYRNGLRDQLLKSRLINKVIRPMVSVSAEETKNLYQASRGADAPMEVRVGLILLGVDGTASTGRVEERARLAQNLTAQLRDGASLANLAGQYSDDPSGLANGGEIGWFKRGELLPEMEKAMFSLKPGEVAEPVRTAQGFNVLKVLEKRRVSGGKAGVGKVKVHARHILIKVPSGAGSGEEARALETIRGIRNELLAGADFVQMARKHSQDDTAKDGGDLKWFGPGMMVAPFEEVAFRLNPRELSEPVRTPFGWHLILVEEKKTLDPDSMEAQSKELEERVMEGKLQAQYNQWLRDLRMRAFVEFR